MSKYRRKRPRKSTQQRKTDNDIIGACCSVPLNVKQYLIKKREAKRTLDFIE